jgi:hypothetical protein
VAYLFSLINDYCLKHDINNGVTIQSMMKSTGVQWQSKSAS